MNTRAKAGVPLIQSGRNSLRCKTIKIKAWNAARTHSIRCAHGLGPAHGISISPAKAGPMSAANAVGLGEFHNAEIDCFGRKMFVHDLIRGSLEQ
jgi:hypothetical protein